MKLIDIKHIIFSQTAKGLDNPMNRVCHGEAAGPAFRIIFDGTYGVLQPFCMMCREICNH